MKQASVWLALLIVLAPAYASGSDPGHWYDNSLIVVSEQTLNNVTVVSNPNPFQVIVSIDGTSDLRIGTTQPIPRKLTRGEYTKLEELLLRWPDTSKNRAEKNAGKYEKAQHLASQSGKYWEVPIAAITPLKPNPPQTPSQPKSSGTPMPI